MGNVPELIYCARGNKTFTDVAITAGFLPGAQLPGTIYHHPHFVDQDWTAYQAALKVSAEAARKLRDGYIAAVAQTRPVMASVLDYERADQLGEVLEWAEEIAPFVERVMLIPKVSGDIPALPRIIGGKQIVFGYSVPTSHGGTDLMLWEFTGVPVHLLGGSPHRQMFLYRNYFRDNCVSVDGNMHMKMATKRGQFWEPGTAQYARDHYWPKLSEAGWHDTGAPLEAFRRSCVNIAAAWRAL
jgi:hypothetical protein